MSALKIDGSFYPKFTSDTTRYSATDRVCIEDAVRRLVAEETSAARPGMLLGKIQSGKTKTFLGIVALAFDNSFDLAIVLTKGTRALTKQTLQRIRKEFAEFQSADLLQIFDIMSVPEGLTAYELEQKIVIVAKKQSDNLDRLVELARDTYPALAKRRALIVDDEADFASVGFRRTTAEGLTSNRTTKQIDELRGLLKSSAFLQVTATPYALYLQPDEVVIQGIEFKPIRPAFTVLVPVHENYIGSDYYFDQSQERETVASFIYRPVSDNDLKVLRKKDGRRFRIEEALTHDAISLLRDAICNFIVGGVIRRWQDSEAGNAPKKFAFLFHTEAQRLSHAWQEQVVQAVRDQLTDAVDRSAQLLAKLLTRAYEDLSRSVRVMNHQLPTLDVAIDQSRAALRDGWLMITKVNSEQQVDQLLDEDGQLRLRTPLNLFIGGQILDRGITIANLIGFFYGRKPQLYQQDTVLQHSRMFGFRPKEDLAVTRFYTEPQIYSAMRRMHESDVALRDAQVREPDAPFVFIQKDNSGRVIPCSPNKILLSNTTTLRAFKRVLPVGFQTDYATRVKPIVERIDARLDELIDGNSLDDPFLLSLAQASQFLAEIAPTIQMCEDEGYSFDWPAAEAALGYLSTLAADKMRHQKVWCLVRRGRKISRTVSAGSHAVYADAPDTTRTEGNVAKRFAIDNPMLMLIRQNGAEEQGWRGTPFYWPVIVAQQNTKTAIFANETAP